VEKFAFRIRIKPEAGWTFESPIANAWDQLKAMHVSTFPNRQINIDGPLQNISNAARLHLQPRNLLGLMSTRPQAAALSDGRFALKLQSSPIDMALAITVVWRLLESFDILAVEMLESADSSLFLKLRSETGSSFLGAYIKSTM
jgi:hypothetical protein